MVQREGATRDSQPPAARAPASSDVSAPCTVKCDKRCRWVCPPSTITAEEPAGGVSSRSDLPGRYSIHSA